VCPEGDSVHKKLIPRIPEVLPEQMEEENPRGTG